jgi:hypothetical protein
MLSPQNSTLISFLNQKLTSILLIYKKTGKTTKIFRQSQKAEGKVSGEKLLAGQLL